MNILLAEDDVNVSVITKLCLEKIGGHTVTVASDGALALSAIRANKYDLIILDGMMPKLSGVEVAKELNATPGFDTPVIFLSAKNEEKDIQQYLSLGTGYIAKPFDPPTICNLIESILKEHNRERVG